MRFYATSSVKENAMIGRKPTSIAVRFQKYVSAAPNENGCILWTGCVHHNGYGVIGRQDGEMVHAHRIAYERAFGEIPEGMWVLHKCDIRACVNPAHLFLGTHDDNMRDMAGKHRSLEGEKHHKAKLTEVDVREIWLRSGNGESRSVVAARFGVTKRTVTNIVRRNNWRHIDLPPLDLPVA